MGGFQNIAIISEKEKKVPSIFSLTLESGAYEWWAEHMRLIWTQLCPDILFHDDLNTNALKYNFFKWPKQRT